MMIKIPIKTTEGKFYRQFLELFRSLPPFNLLRTRELDVLSQILFQNNKYKSIDPKTRSLIIFSKEIRKEMRSSINISEDIFNNNLSGIRKKGLVNEDNELVSLLSSLYFDKEFKLEFNFKL